MSRRWKLVWCPQWFCQNYTVGKSHGSKCPYCPYSYDVASSRLMYEGRSTSSNAQAPMGDLIDFFFANAEPIGRFLEICGGEPLLYSHLPEVLGTLRGWRWAITSNTISTEAIERVIEKCGGRMDGCVSWTASYHPFAGSQDRFAKSIEAIRRHSRCTINVTIVVSRHTYPILRECLEFANSLPINRVQFHSDTHGDGTSKLLQDVRQTFLGIPVLAGRRFNGGKCRRYDHLLCLGPDGTLYPCATKAYLGLDGITKVDSKTRLVDLPQGVYPCRAECFACCDHPKRVN